MNDSDRDLSNLTKDAGILALGRNLQRHKARAPPSSERNSVVRRRGLNSYQDYFWGGSLL